MKLKEALDNMSLDVACGRAKKIAESNKLIWDADIKAVFSALVKHPKQIPASIGGRADDEPTVILKWIRKYYAGKSKCASQRLSKSLGTVPDPAIETIIGARLSNLLVKDLTKITYAHRLAMSAENILGLLLEEYLAENLFDAGWFCAWGETIRSVDFVYRDGERLLQVKNRSNSENSSSSAIRDGTPIEKWYRIEAAKIEYHWDDLCDICGVKHLSEDGFISFVSETLQKNPQCLAIEENNPWKKE